MFNPEAFSTILFEKMKLVDPAVDGMELYEFRYALDNLFPEQSGWGGVQLEGQEEIEERVKSSAFFNSIQLKPKLDGKIVLDENVVRLTRMLFVGLVSGQYSTEWVRAIFYFDVRGFNFLVRTVYFNEAILTHLGGQPFKSFEPKQKDFERVQDIGYQAFKNANAEIDAFFMESVRRLIAVKGTPVVLAIAGPTAAGKTEIVERLRGLYEQIGKKVTSIELDNFLTDRDYREEQGIHSLGKEAIHFELFKRSLEELIQGQKIFIPKYDTINATSTHDLQGRLKAGCRPIEIEAADIIFIEGNFPFLLKEVADLIAIKVVYLTDDAVRLKRKWKRDIDYRKKYDPNYLRNRFFKDQFLMAQKCYLPQLAVCDIFVDTTAAALWVTPEIAQVLA
jgi:uridine kinase